MADPISAAVSKIQSAATVNLTAPGHTDEETLPTVKFPRLSVERRVLGHITDEIDNDALGPRNTLAALTDALMRDPNTTRPRGGLAEAFEIDGLTLQEIAERVLEMLEDLIKEGLVKQHADGVYVVTDAGHVELAS